MRTASRLDHIEPFYVMECAKAAAHAPTPPRTSSKPSGPRPKPKSARRRSRELALQGLYEWLVSGAEPGAIDVRTHELDGFDKSYPAHLDALLHRCIRQAADIDAVLTQRVDRRTSLLSPIEHDVLMIGVYELQHCIEIPCKVAINEAVELAESFGGTDGHNYVNGVLGKAAARAARR